MPLRAVDRITGTELIAPLLSEAEWQALKAAARLGQAELIMPCCGSAAELRTSKLGTRHFKHKARPQNCAWENETLEHLSAKAEIVIACQQAGYAVTPEHAEADWRADVLAVRGGARLAFEVQWTRQSLDDYRMRQRRYAAAGVRGCWFFRHAPARPTELASHDLPLFALRFDADAQIPYVEYRPDPWLDSARVIRLGEFVRALLARQIRFCGQAWIAEQQDLRFVFARVQCWKCGSVNHIAAVDGPFSPCGMAFGAAWERLHRSPFLLHPAVTEAAARLAGQAHTPLRLAEVTGKHAGEARGFACQQCGAGFDLWMLREEVFPKLAQPGSALIDYATTGAVYIEPQAIEALPHWCYGQHGRFCCE